MRYHPTAQDRHPADGHRWMRALALAAVVAGLLVLAASAFVLSYAGIHALALSAGVSPKVARIYPLIFDAMLVVACAAVLSLRGAGLPSRLYAWLSMLALFAAAAGADTLHATGVKPPHKPAAAAAAIIPWALVLIGFGLLLCMLRQARLRRAALAAAPRTVFRQPTGHVEVRAGIHELFGAAASPARASDPHGADRSDAAPYRGSDLAIETDPGQDDPASDEGLTWLARSRDEQAGGNGAHGSDRRAPAFGADRPATPPASNRSQSGSGPDRPASAFSPAPTMPLEAESDGRGRGGTPGAEPSENEDAFLRLVAPTRPEATAGTGPGAPGPAAWPQADPGPDAVTPAQTEAAPDATAPAHIHPAAAAAPPAQTEPAPHAAAPAQMDSAADKDVESQTDLATGGADEPRPTSPPNSQPVPPPGPEPAPDPAPGIPVPPQPRPAPESEAHPEPAAPSDTESALTAESGDGRADESEPQQSSEAAAGAVGVSDAVESAGAVGTSETDSPPETKTEAAAPAPPFDRMRSSPVPPEE
jgi:Protein of unknown function (DUF2637)